ncbi:LapA family protein [Marinobacterium arenosum]|uniref:LapA family protein n=1 Tax=Marinobacterium arenosum TaxID=2862496 RepID=UPI001C98DB2A|nr:LapA family protein [Marinobacterium arenosum]MBY4676019.1 LapA family protein [Marinobacterium arenosum]
MRWLKTLLIGALCLIALLVGVLFTIHNTQTVAIDLVFVQLPQASLSLWLMAFLLLGAALGMLVSLMALLVLRTRLGAARRRFNHAQKELDQLRTAALKDGA